MRVGTHKIKPSELKVVASEELQAEVDKELEDLAKAEEEQELDIKEVIKNNKPSAKKKKPVSTTLSEEDHEDT